MSNSGTSSTEEDTPRVQEEDFSFFDSDKEQKGNQKRIREKLIESDSDSDDAGDRLHGSGRRDSRHETSHKSPLENKNSFSEVRKNRSSKEKLMVRVPLDTTYDLHNNSDSDSSESVTDVSPLTSPDATPRNSTQKIGTMANVPDKAQSKKKEKTSVRKPAQRKSKGDALSVEDLLYSSESSHISSDERVIETQKRKRVQRKKKSRYEGVHHRTEISAEKHRRRLLDVAAENSMDISQLLEVVLEMEQENQVRKLHQNERSSLLPPPLKPSRKKNMSFSNEQALKIDRENKRLLERLSQLNCKAHRPSSASSTRSSASSFRSNASTSRSSRRPFSSASVRTPPNPGPRVYHSATNRLRDQQRIERENLALLKRLQMAKSTSALRRDNLLRDYERQTGNSFDLNSRRSSNRRPKQAYSRYNDIDDSLHERCRKSRPVWQDSW